MFYANRGAGAAIAMLSLAMLATSQHGRAGQVGYTIDPEHTYPSFEADHLGVSTWRGKFNKSSGKVVLDKATSSGTVEVTVDVASIDFGHDKLNTWAVGKELLDTARYPNAVFKGRLTDFIDGSPTHAVGTLTLHGVTKPLTLNIDRFKCIPHPMFKRELCGADALGSFRRDEFGMDAGKSYGFDMSVQLRIQVEALQDEAPAKK
ncbi:MAG TPA: YceI family protein [Dyella sp.]|uniref:YceI family protein n=1 Tax=Dyella sp. TaxID=1869338 RepID=UPI002F95C771